MMMAVTVKCSTDALCLTCAHNPSGTRMECLLLILVRSIVKDEDDCKADDVGDDPFNHLQHHTLTH